MRNTVLAGAVVWCALVSFDYTINAATPIRGPESYGGHYYYLLSPSDWNDAEAAAVGLGGHLVTINDAPENNWILQTFGPGANWLWLGLNRAGGVAEWTWSSSETSAFRNWGVSNTGSAPEPNNDNGNEYYAAMTPYVFNGIVPGAWLDTTVSATVNPDSQLFTRGIVEVVPEPGTLYFLGLSGLVALSLRRQNCARI
jgi:hypothetical protein